MLGMDGKDASSILPSLCLQQLPLQSILVYTIHTNLVNSQHIMRNRMNSDGQQVYKYICHYICMLSRSFGSCIMKWERCRKVS